TLVADMNQVEIAEDNVEHKGDGQHHHMIFRQSFGQESIKAKGHNGAGSDDANQTVNQVQAILFEDGAVVACALAQQHQLVPPLAQGQEEGQEAAEDVEPGGEALYVNHSDTSRDPQHKAGGHNENIHQHHPLQPVGVGNLAGEVDEQHQAKTKIGRASCRERQ